ncbi:MAG: hypothetical protein HYY84_04325 [Deltaproteobacteria bacterium]|nr:hypothetical protein [Deltaproteobacteria bacterium]
MVPLYFACTCAFACAPALVRGPVVENADLRDLEGEPLRVEAYRGRVVALHFVATWATLSLVDVKYLAALDERVGYQGLTVIIAVTDREGARVAAPLKSAFRLGCRVASADAPVVEGRTPLGRIAAVPFTALLDRQGRVVFRTNAPLDRPAFERLVNRLLREEP